MPIEQKVTKIAKQPDHASPGSPSFLPSEFDGGRLEGESDQKHKPAEEHPLCDLRDLLFKKETLDESLTPHSQPCEYR